MLMAEHSMCQPGRPRPKGASHCAQAGSSDFAFQSTKSRAFSLSYLSVSTRAPAFMPDDVEPGQPAVLGKGGDAEVDAAVVRVGVAAGHQPLDEGDHLGDVLGGAGDDLGLLHAAASSMSSQKAAIQGAVKVAMSWPAASACWMIRSSTSVMFMTSSTCHPLYLQGAAQQVRGHEGAEVSDVAAVVDGEDRRRTSALAGGFSGAKSSRRPVRVLKRRRVMCSSALRMRAVRSSEQPAGPVQRMDGVQ